MSIFLGIRNIDGTFSVVYTESYMSRTMYLGAHCWETSGWGNVANGISHAL